MCLCHMSHIMCQVSCVTCQVSCIIIRYNFTTLHYISVLYIRCSSTDTCESTAWSKADRSGWHRRLEIVEVQSVIRQEGISYPERSKKRAFYWLYISGVTLSGIGARGVTCNSLASGGSMFMYQNSSIKRPFKYGRNIK